LSSSAGNFGTMSNGTRSSASTTTVTRREPNRALLVAPSDFAALTVVNDVRLAGGEPPDDADSSRRGDVVPTALVTRTDRLAPWSLATNIGQVGSAREGTEPA
jgi:hypothetical protein